MDENGDETICQRPYSVGRESWRAARWQLFGTIAKSVATLASMLVLARLLSPAEYGRAAIVVSIIAAFQILAAFGFAQAIIGAREVSSDFMDSMFTASLALSMAMYGTIALSAPILAGVYGDPALVMWLRVGGIGIIAALLLAVPRALLERQLRYARTIGVDVVVTTVTAASAIVLALAGFGIWALFMPMVIGAVAGMAVAYPAARFSPRFRIDTRQYRSAWQYGSASFFSNLANFACNNAVPLIMAKMWGPAVLGLYTFAYTKHALPFDAGARLIAGSLFPIFRRIADDVARVRRAFLRIIRLSAFLLLPMHAVILASAPMLFYLFFGARWDAAVLPFQLFCIVPIVRILAMGVTAVLNAIGAPMVAARIASFRAMGYAVAMGTAVLFRFGIIHLVGVLVVLDCVIVASYLIACMRRLNIPFAAYAQSVVLPVTLSAFLFFMVVVGQVIMVRLGLTSPNAFLASFAMSITVFLILGKRALRAEWTALSAHLHHRA